MDIQDHGKLFFTEYLIQTLHTIFQLVLDLLLVGRDDAVEIDLPAVLSVQTAKTVILAGPAQHHASEAHAITKRCVLWTIGHSVPPTQPGLILMGEPGQKFQHPDRPVGGFRHVTGEGELFPQVPAATEKQDFYVLYTTGMSDLPMTLPDELSDREDLKYAELYLFLPGSWDMGRSLMPVV